MSSSPARRNGKARVLFGPATIAEQQGAGLVTDEHVFRRYRRNIVLLLIVGIALAFDPDLTDGFSLSKYTLLLLAVLALLVLGAVSWARSRQDPFWRNGLQWPVAAVVGWTAVTTVTSISPGLSVQGLQDSHEGLVGVVAAALLFFLIVDAFDVRHLKRAAAVLWYGGGGIVIGYGALQLHDRLISWGGTWDPVNWPADPSSSPDWVFSTIGNPNFMAGFLVMVLPVGVALFLTRQPWWARLLTVVLVVLAIAELLYATTRGAWLAVLVSLPVMAVLLFREVWAHRRVVLGIAGGVLAALVLVLATVSTPVAVGKQFGTIFDPQGHTTVERVELWRVAWRMAGDRPVTGYGPEMYEKEFNRYQTARYVEEDGPQSVANGPHNVFFNALANQGFPGLVLFVGLLVVVALRGVGALRRLRQMEDGRKPEQRPPLLEARLLLAGLMAAGVAYLVQGSFNAQVFDLVSLFWIVLALIAVVAVDAGVPNTLRPRALLAAGPAGEGGGGPTASTARQAGLPVSPARRLGPPTPSDGVDGVTVLVGVLALAAAAGAGWWVTGPYWAEQDAVKAGQQALLATQRAQQGDAGGVDTAAAKAVALLEQAIDRNPWDPQYHLTLADFLVKWGSAEVESVAATGVGSGSLARARFEQARHHYRRAGETGRTFIHYGKQGDGLVKLAEQKAPGLDREALLREAVAAYRTGLRSNPWSVDVAQNLAAAYVALGDRDAALEVLEAVLRIQVVDSHKVKPLTALATFHEKGGEQEKARAAWRQVLAIDPDNDAARKALKG